MRAALLSIPALFLAAACSSTVDPPALPAVDNACAGPCPQTNIKHVVVVIQENHTFDNHFGRYCTAPAGSNPACNDGPGCCEAAPDKDPSGVTPRDLTDLEMQFYDPDHSSACETKEINGGAMDRFATESCGGPKTVAVASAKLVQPYWDLAAKGALADRYFQPLIGQSSANDMYFARAAFVFEDNSAGPKGAMGLACTLSGGSQQEFTDKTIGDLLAEKAVPWNFYIGGYTAMATAQKDGLCPNYPDDCEGRINFYPCTYDASDIPFAYYPSTRDNPAYFRDLDRLDQDLVQGKLPAVSFVKALGYKTEHPGLKDKLSDGVAFVNGLVQKVLSSRYRESTLVLVTYDEGGGYWDHVKPPPDSKADGKSYGTRVPMIAVGPFVKQNFVSHVTMEHSSVVKFVEWNFLGATGQLKTRDAEVNNLGSLLDPKKTGTPVPE